VEAKTPSCPDPGLTPPQFVLRAPGSPRPCAVQKSLDIAIEMLMRSLLPWDYRIYADQYPVDLAVLLTAGVK